MPLIEVIGFSADLHVLRGQSPVSLNRLLRVSWGPLPSETGTVEAYVASRAPNPSDVTIEFRPVFPYPPNAPKFANFGIEIDRGSGQMFA